jgi:hypothetical protein
MDDEITRHLDDINIIYTTTILQYPQTVIEPLYETIYVFINTKKKINIYLNDANICEEKFYAFICMALLYIPEDKLDIYYNSQLIVTNGKQTDVQINTKCPRGPMTCDKGRVKKINFFTNELDIISAELRKIRAKTPSRTLSQFINFVQFFSNAGLSMSDDIDSLQIEIIEKYASVKILVNTNDITNAVFQKYLSESGYNYFLEICDKIGIDPDLRHFNKAGALKSQCIAPPCEIPRPYKIIGTREDIQTTLDFIISSQNEVVETVSLPALIETELSQIGREIPGLREALNRINSNNFALPGQRLARLREVIAEWQKSSIDSPLRQELIDDVIADDREALDFLGMLGLIDHGIEFDRYHDVLPFDLDDQYGRGYISQRGGIGIGIGGIGGIGYMYGAFVILLSAQMLQHYLLITDNVEKKPTKTFLLTGIQNFINKLFILY